MSGQGNTCERQEKLLEDKYELKGTTVPHITSQRWIMGYMGLVFGLLLYLLRVNMSIAIVCMVKPEVPSNQTEVQDVVIAAKYNARNTSLIQLSSNGTEVTRDYPQYSYQDGCQEIASDTMYETAEFTWSKTQQSWILSSYYYGCTLVMVPGGWINKRFGGKRVIALSLLVSAVGTLLLPSLTRLSVVAPIIIRVILGICSGIAMPGWLGLVGAWAPPFERSRMVAIFWGGQYLGTIVACISSGFLCSNGFDNGWGSIFYTNGAVTLLFLALWLYIIADSPASHPRITEAERRFLENEIPQRPKNDHKESVPWMKIMTSVPVWTVFICHICSTWNFYIMLNCLPLFLKEVLKFDIQSNGVYSSLPFISCGVGVALSSSLADCVLKRRCLTPTATRRIFQVVGFLGTAVAILSAGFITCDKRELVVMCVCISLFCTAIGDGGGFPCNIVEIAPQYASVIFAISNTIANIPGMIGPLVVAEITPNGTSEEWRTVFYISAGCSVVGALVFGSLARSEIQPWADRPTEIVLSVVLDEAHTEKLSFLGNSSSLPVSKDGRSTSDIVSTLLPD